MELHPTGEVTEYTATVAYELLREGEEGRQKVDSVKFVVRAEGNLQNKTVLFYHCLQYHNLNLPVVKLNDIALLLG